DDLRDLFELALGHAQGDDLPFVDQAIESEKVLLVRLGAKDLADMGDVEEGADAVQPSGDRAAQLGVEALELGVEPEAHGLDLGILLGRLGGGFGVREPSPEGVRRRSDSVEIGHRGLAALDEADDADALRREVLRLLVPEGIDALALDVLEKGS